MGSSKCCLTFEMSLDEMQKPISSQHPPQFIARILQPTKLIETDYFTFYEGHFDKLIVFN